MNLLVLIPPFLVLTFACRTINAAPYVEYPGHPATYGDHTLSANWVDGPVTTLTLSLETDESILHADGNGQSQRTARNTLNFDSPSTPANPQNFDNLALLGEYGRRLPLLQHLTANGTSTLSYEFPTPVTTGFDLFVTDVDSSDVARVRAFSTDNQAIDMNLWTLAGEGDLSLYKDTGTAFSETVAPTPITTFSNNRVKLEAPNGTNYNRSYTILRAPVGVAVERVSVEFVGQFNSPNRAQGGNGSHIYVAITSTPDLPDFNASRRVDGGDFLVWQRGFDPANGDALGSEGDANLDGIVDELDLIAWRLRFGDSSANFVGISPVPEPSGLLLTILCLFGGSLHLIRSLEHPRQLEHRDDTHVVK